MKFKLKLYDFDKDINNIGFDVISDDKDIHNLVHGEFEELFKYDLWYLWKPPYEPITFNMVVEEQIGHVAEEDGFIIYSNGVVE